MKLDKNFKEAIRQIERERGISSSSVIQVIESALLSAYKKKMIEQEKLTLESDVELKIDTDNDNEVKIFAKKEVVETSETPDQISLTLAKKKHPETEIGEWVTVQQVMSSKEFDRLANQAARQAITQKLREAEKEAIIEEYRDRIGHMLTATVQRLEKNNVIVKLNNKSELVLPKSEQLHSDRYRYGDKIRVYLSEIRETSRGPHIVISRTSPGLVRCLFEIDIPEIADETVLIKAIAREAGYRTKIAVHSVKGNVDPVGACIGSRGSRIHPIIDELRGEKIDIVRWDEDPGQFIINALSPAKVIQVSLTENDKVASIVVPDDQLSLAIGRDGQNVRLAANLTSCHLDIMTETRLREQKQEYQQAIQDQVRHSSSEA